MRVGFIGLGNMGAPMAQHVVAVGHDVAVSDVRPEPVATLAAAGARAASGPADAATDVDVVSVVVRDDTQVLDVTTGAGGVIDAMRPGAVLAIHSTVTLACLRAVDGAASARGVLVLDAGVSGGVPGATDGTLLVFAGGPTATLDAARPAIEPWAREIVHFGEIGSGMAAKVARNYVQYAVFGAVHEGQTLAQAAGVDLATFAHVVRSTNAIGLADFTLDRADATVRRVDELGDRGPALADAASLGLKDLAVVEALASELGVALPGLAGARRGFPGSIGVDVESVESGES